MSSVLVWSMVDGGFEHQLGQTKHYENWYLVLLC
jgi:hypothetical protein